MTNPFLKIMVHLQYKNCKIIRLQKYRKNNLNSTILNENNKVLDIKDLYSSQENEITFFTQKSIKILLKMQKHHFA